jgi:hypothetical protein
LYQRLNTQQNGTKENNGQDKETKPCRLDRDPVVVVVVVVVLLLLLLSLDIFWDSTRLSESNDLRTPYNHLWVFLATRLNRLSRV